MSNTQMCEKCGRRYDPANPVCDNVSTGADGCPFKQPQPATPDGIIQEGKGL